MIPWAFLLPSCTCLQSVADAVEQSLHHCQDTCPRAVADELVLCVLGRPAFVLVHVGGLGEQGGGVGLWHVTAAAGVLQSMGLLSLRHLPSLFGPSIW